MKLMLGAINGRVELGALILRDLVAEEVHIA